MVIFFLPQKNNNFHKNTKKFHKKNVFHKNRKKFRKIGPQIKKNPDQPLPNNLLWRKIFIYFICKLCKWDPQSLICLGPAKVLIRPSRYYIWIIRFLFIKYPLQLFGRCSHCRRIFFFFHLAAGSLLDNLSRPKVSLVLIAYTKHRVHVSSLNEPEARRGLLGFSDVSIHGYNKISQNKFWGDFCRIFWYNSI